MPRADGHELELTPTGDGELQEELAGVGDGVDDTPGPQLTLDERMIVLERRMREFETEWLSMYDQFRSLYGRIARRQQREEEPTPTERPMNPAALALLGRTG